jgi:cytochrome c oxidase cbb3-type subunit 3
MCWLAEGTHCMRSIFSKFALGLLLTSPLLIAQGRRSVQYDQAAVERGRALVIANCAACHGADARGGRGPDLGRSLVVNRDTNALALGAYVRAGSPNAGMPSFNLTDDQMLDIWTFIHASTQTQSSRGLSVNPAAILVGDARAGEIYFRGEGKCVTCHSTTGDLKGIGAKYDPVALQGRIAFPRGRGSYPGFGQAPTDVPLKASATLPNGHRVSGTVLILSDYSITLRDPTGARYTVSRTDAAKVEVTDPLQAHLDRLKVLTDKEMHDLTAYLSAFK